MSVGTRAGGGRSSVVPASPYPFSANLRCHAGAEARH